MGNARARKFYASLGFVELATSTLPDGSAIMGLRLK
jgi:hypothetical protein